MLGGMKALASALAILVVGCSAPYPALPGSGGDGELSEKASTRPKRKLLGTWSARHWLDHLEQCGGGCQYRTRSYSTVGLELSANGVARAVDDGRTHERFTAHAGDRSHMTEWNRTWMGSWSEGADQLQLKLEETERSCHRTRDDGTREDLCEAVKLQLQCERMRILLAQDKPRTAWAWVCDGQVPESAGLTPLPWVFGEERVLVALDTGKNRPTARRYMTTRPKKEAKAEKKKSQ